MTPDRIPPYEAAVQEIRAGNVRPLYLLSGPSHLAAQAVSEALREAVLGESANEFDAIHVQGRDASWPALVEVFRTPSWSGGRRLVTVDEPPGLAPRRGVKEEDPAPSVEDGAGPGEAGGEGVGAIGEGAGAAGEEAILHYLEAPAPDVVVVLRSRAPVDRRRTLVKRIESAGGLVDCRQPSERLGFGAARAEAERWLERRLAGEGRTLVPGLAKRIVERVGANLDLLEREVEKILLFTDARRLDGSVMDVVSGNADEDVFGLVDAIGARDGRRVESELARLSERGESPLGILALLASQVRIMRVGKAILRESGTPAQAAKELGANPYRVQRALAQARRFSDEELDRALEAVWLADWRVKSGRWPEREALEWAVATMVAGGYDRPSRLPPESLPPFLTTSAAGASSGPRRARRAPS